MKRLLPALMAAALLSLNNAHASDLEFEPYNVPQTAAEPGIHEIENQAAWNRFWKQAIGTEAPMGLEGGIAVVVAAPDGERGMPMLVLRRHAGTERLVCVFMGRSAASQFMENPMAAIVVRRKDGEPVVLGEDVHLHEESCR